MVVHIISVALTGFYFYLANPGSDLFSWHPVCMSTAFVLLLLQAIVIFSPESSLTPNSPRPVISLSYQRSRQGRSSISEIENEIYYLTNSG